jgi:pyruvate carboxylase
MRVSIAHILQSTRKVAEVCICYTGDLANPSRTKYTIDYYVDLARRIEDTGAHILCIKDMAGLLRPRAAHMLIGKLKETVSIPIHLHTHDTSGNGIASLMEAIVCGVDIVDVALAPMAGMTSQPSINALVAALRGSERETGMGNKALQPLCDYWEVVRDYYAPFECGLKSGTSEVYYHEIPGGQYSNLRPQVAAMGLLDRWNDVKHAFAVVNRLVGDIPKVTPSSKMVGDFAVFLVQNDLLMKHEDFDRMVEATRSKLIDEAGRLDFPSSVVSYFQGHLGKPPGGFPEELRKAVLKGLPVMDGLPGANLAPVDLDALREQLAQRHGRAIPEHTAISAALYPRVLEQHLEFLNLHEDVSVLDTPTYFFGLEPGQEINVELEPGKTLVITLAAIGDPDEEGNRSVYFELNGQGRQVRVRDHKHAPPEETRRKAQKSDPSQVGAPMPGTVIAVHCTEGAKVKEGDPLVTLEAMKMETVVRAPRDGTLKELVPDLKSRVQVDDLLAVLG